MSNPPSTRIPGAIPAAQTPRTPQPSLLWAMAHHAGDIARIHGMLFPERWDTASVESSLANPGSVALVATVGGPTNVVGFVLAVVAADEAEILSIGVLPDCQRRGIAGRLLEGARRAAARAGANVLFLEVAPSNRAALALYTRAGFKEAGRRPGYYRRHDGSREDAINMRLSLVT